MQVRIFLRGKTWKGGRRVYSLEVTIEISILFKEESALLSEGAFQHTNLIWEEEIVIPRKVRTRIPK